MESEFILELSAVIGTLEMEIKYS